MYSGETLQNLSRNVTRHASDDIVIVVSDDNSFGAILHAEIFSYGWQPEPRASASDFLMSPRTDSPGCIVLDASLADLTASNLTQLICCYAVRCPVIVLTGHGAPAMAVNGTKFGVFFVPKSSGPIAVADEIRSAIHAVSEVDRIEGCYRTLTLRERQVMKFVAEGLLNKQVAFELQISEITVKAHRGQVMRKMNARTLAHLVNMVAKLDIGLGALH
jgi:FixJ family two-component response regulator